MRSDRNLFQPDKTHCFLIRRSKRSHWGIKVILFAVLGLCIATIPSVAQNGTGFPNTDRERAPVVLDGRELFEISNSTHFEAAERVRLINQELAKEVQSPQNTEVSLGQEDGLPVIRINDRYLMTVTDRDMVDATQPAEQASIWVKRLQSAIVRAKQERTAEYLRRSLVKVLGLFLSLGLAIWLVRWLSNRIVPYIERRANQPNSPLHTWEKPVKNGVRAIALLWQAIAAILGIYVISDVFPQTRISRYQLFRLLSNPVIPLGSDNSKSLLDLLGLVVLTVGLWFGVGLLSKTLKNTLRIKMGQDQGFPEFIAALFQYGLVFLGLLTLLPLWGFNLSSLALVASFLGVGIGFGIQNIVNNFVSGLIIVLERPIKVGDFVTVGSLQGLVDRIGSRSTVIRTLDQVAIIVPNSRFLENEVINRSYGSPVSRLRIPVGVAYGSEIDLVKKALIEAAKEHSEILLHPKPQVWFMEFGDSSLNFELQVWTDDPQKQPRIKSDLNYKIEANLRRYGLEVPFPQRDLNLRSPILDRLLRQLLKHYSSQDTTSDTSSPLPEPRPSVSGHPSQLPSENGSFERRDLLELAELMRGSGGVDRRDRRFRLNVYPLCFIGSEAVDWLVTHLQCSREEARAIGQSLCDRGVCHHVTDDHPFRDAYYFYRFYADES